MNSWCMRWVAGVEEVGRDLQGLLKTRQESLQTRDLSVCGLRSETSAPTHPAEAWIALASIQAPVQAGGVLLEQQPRDSGCE